MIPKALLGQGSTLAFACVTALACSRTLDPTVLVEEDDDAAECVTFVSAGTRYDLCPEPLSFDLAAVDCASRGATLAAVGSAEENDLIASSSTYVASGNFWLGGRRDDAFVWSWPDGSVFWRGGRDGAAETGAYVRWQPEEPNNASTVANEPESCLALTQDGNDWNDRACSLSLPYACETPF